MGARLAFAAAVVLSLAACAMPQQGERLVVRHGKVDAVVAARYAGRESNPVDTIRIELAQAPDFELLMPDGTWLPAAGITRSSFLAHGARADGESRAFFEAPGPKSGADEWINRHAVVMLYTRPSDGLSLLNLSACGRAFAKLLRAKDGAVSGFPMSVEEFDRVFGPVTQRERFGIITGASCL